MEVNGVVIVDKPRGITSFSVVSRVRRVFEKRSGRKVKVGHTGTLDPLASGVLVVMVGGETKRSKEMSGEDKEYEVSCELGWATWTLDAWGEVKERWEVEREELMGLSLERVREVVVSLVGDWELPVPSYSAMKRRGRRLYELARRGEMVRPRRLMEVKSARLMSCKESDGERYPEIVFRVEVGSGTYTRSLVEELGRRLGGVPAVQTNLVRLRVGNFKLSQSVDLEELERSSEPESYFINNEIRRECQLQG